MEDKENDDNGTSAEGEAEGESPETVVEISIGDVTEATNPEQEEEQKAAPKWVKELRRQNRESQKKIRELEQERDALKPRAQTPTLPPRPTMSSVEFDEEAFAAATDKWYEAKRAVDEAHRAQADANRKAQEEFAGRVKGYETAKQELGADDFEDAELLVQKTFSQAQQALLVDSVDNAALVTLALGRNPAKAKEVASITNPARFVAAIAKLESQIKMNKKTPPPAEKRVPSASRPLSVDRAHDALVDKASKSGDLTDLLRAARAARKNK